MTDEAGNLLWYADYKVRGGIREAHNLKDAHQQFRLQNQYADEETGLHYNFFRYYDPYIRRFTQLDPIGLAGGENLYQFVANTLTWADPFGLRANGVRPSPNMRRSPSSRYNSDGGAMVRNKVIFQQNNTQWIKSPNIPVRMQGKSISLTPTPNPENVEMMKYVAGEIKDKLVDFANLSPNNGNLILPSPPSIGTCNKFKYECTFDKKLDDSMCQSAINILNVDGCYSRTTIYSDTNSYLVPEGVSVQCKEIK